MLTLVFYFFFFFFKQKTAYEMRISDWSSDVCSSDLYAPGATRPHRLSLADVGLRPTYRSWYRLAVAGGLLCMPLASLINLAFQSLLGGPVANPQLEALAPEGFTWTSLVALLLLVGVLVPFIEEIIFRGLLYGDRKSTSLNS